MSSRTTVVVGKSELDWSSLCQAIGTVVLTGAVPTQLGSPMFGEENSYISSLSHIEVLRTRVKGDDFPFISTLVAGNRQASTDPRDLVYELLGLAMEHDHQLRKPDYLESNSASAVFINLVDCSIRIERSLDRIYVSQGRTKSCLPSWCPDWTKPPR